MAHSLLDPASGAASAASGPHSRLRRHRRVSLDLPGVYSLPARGWRRWLLALLHPAGADSVRAYPQTPCRILNLGLGGARLRMDRADPLGDGQHLLLGITLANGSLLETIDAEVLEQAEPSDQGTCVRVLFHPMDPHIQLQLGRLIGAFQEPAAPAE